jgi:hypothetical protein
VGCEANFFCPTPLTQIPCPPPTISAPNANSFLNCTCPPGTYGTVSDATHAKCVECPRGDVCLASAAKKTCEC